MAQITAHLKPNSTLKASRVSGPNVSISFVVSAGYLYEPLPRVCHRWGGCFVCDNSAAVGCDDLDSFGVKQCLTQMKNFQINVLGSGIDAH